jgi:hormone-sensitive lipase
MENNFENNKEIELEYILSNEDIKFPTFFDEEISKVFKSQKMSKETLIQDLNQIINELQYIIETLTNISHKDINSFNTLCLNYNLNSYDFVIIINLIKELNKIILNKLESNGKPFQLTIFDPKQVQNTEDTELFLAQHKKNDKEFKLISKSSSEYINDIKEIYDSNNECAILFMGYTMKYYLSFVIKVKSKLNEYLEIEDFQNEKNIQNHRKNMIVFFDLILLIKKLLRSNMIVANSFFINKDDIFNFEEDSEEWQKMKKVMYRVHTKNDDKINEEFFNLKKKNERTSVYVSKSVNPSSNLLLSASKFTGLLMKFTMNSDKNLMTYESKESVILDDKNITQEMIKLGKKKLIKVVYEKRYPTITFREKIYMRRDYPEITLDYIKSLLTKIYGDDIISKNFGNTKQKERIKLDPEVKSKLPLWAKKVNKNDKKYYVSTRLINNYNIKFSKDKENARKTSFIKFFKNRNVVSSPKALMIYIHGGGFLNTGFFFHENYLREICKKINIPILGINYKGAPEHPYPEGINDCYQAYMWIMDNCERELGFKPEKIILAGDSSGGNYALCLNFLLLSMNLLEGKKIHIPDFLFPLYPCSNASRKNMSLSLASSLEDSRITIKGLRYINECYRGYYPNELDPFINPRDAPEFLIKKMPRTRFMTGSHDPLRDDCIRLVYKMCKAEMDVKVYDFYNYQHGFISLNNPNISGIPRYIFCKEINEFMNNI